jgi:hypothetical protein
MWQPCVVGPSSEERRDREEQALHEVDECIVYILITIGLGFTRFGHDEIILQYIKLSIIR